MSNLTIRNLDDDVVETLKTQAKENQRSLEAEVRFLLTQQASHRTRVAEFRERTRGIADASAVIPQTDSVVLLREDRDR